MKLLKFKRTSIHYQLALLWCDDYPNNISNNICGYSWQVLLGAIEAIGLILLAAVFLSLTIVLPSVYLVVYLETGIGFNPPSEVIAGLTLDTLIIFIALCGIVSHYYTEYKQSRHNRQKLGNQPTIKNDSFIVEIYQKFKNKTCAKIEFI